MLRLVQTMRLLPAILSALVLGAHASRNGWPLVVVALLAATPLLLIARRLWAVRVVQAVLVLGALEWVRTLMRLTAVRQAHGMPYERMAWILGAVAAVCLVGAWLVGRWWAARTELEPGGER